LNEDAGLTGKLQHLCMPGKDFFFPFMSQVFVFSALMTSVLLCFSWYQTGMGVARNSNLEGHEG